MASSRGAAALLLCWVSWGHPLSDEFPPGTHSHAALRGWERIHGAVETADLDVAYEFYVMPERPAFYTITRYRVARRGRRSAGAAPSAPETEKYIWNAGAGGGPLRCFERRPGGWRRLEHNTPEYRAEMDTAIRIYMAHRAATVDPAQTD